MLRKLILASIATLLFSVIGHAQQQNFGSNGGLISVTSLPATCAVGQGFIVPNGADGQVFFCGPGANTFTSSAAFGGVIDPGAFGARFNGKSCFSNVNTITFANAGNTVTCNVAAFCNGTTVACAAGQTSDVGKQVQATVNSCCGVQADYLGVLAFANLSTTITAVSSATSATISQNFTAACGGNCIFVWATNDDAAITLAETAWASANKCGAMQLPSGITLLLQPHFNNPGTNCLGAEPELNYTAEVDGSGKGATQLGIAAGFNFAGCPISPGGCFFNYLESVVQNLAIVGFGWGNTGLGATRNLMAGALGSEWRDVSCVAVGGSDANLTGIFTGVGFRAWGLTVDGCGRQGGELGAITKLYYCFFGDTLGPNLLIDGDLTDFGCDYGGTGGTQIMVMNGASSRYHGVGSNLFACGIANASAIFWQNLTATVILDGARWNCGTATSNGAFIQGASSKLILTGGSTIGGTTAAINRSAGTVFTDPTTVFAAGAITSIAPACAATTGGTACSLVAGSTNEKGTMRITASAAATGTVTMTFAGTYAGPSGAAPRCTTAYVNAGGTGAWSLTTTTPIVQIVRSTTVPAFNWNQTGNLTAASTYDIDYVCPAT